MFKEEQNDLYKLKIAERDTSHTWTPTINRKPLIITGIVVVLILVLGFLIYIHPYFDHLIPSIEHSGVELYTSGTYLKYDKGDTFQKLVAELSFVEYGEVNSFSYHDSVLRNSWHNPTFPDAFILELDMGESYILAIQEMEMKEALNFKSGGDSGYGHAYAAYAAAESGQGDYLFVFAFEETQRVVLLLITDADSWGSAYEVRYRCFPVPGEPAPIPIEKQQSN